MSADALDTTEEPDRAADPAAETDPAAGATPARGGWRVRWPAIAVVTLLVASAVLATVLYLTQHRVDRQTDAAVAAEVVRAASAATTSLLSYTPDNLDGDLATAKSHLTGDFLAYYTDFADQVVAPAVRDKAVTADVSVVRAAVSELHPDSAKVLVFLNQVTTSRDRPDPAQTASSVMVGMTKVNGAWLISAFDPV